MFSLQSNMKQFQRDFKNRMEDMQKVTARTLTRVAQQANVLQRRKLQDGRLTLRAERFALGSLRTYKAGESRPINRQDSVVGTFSTYLPVTDQGGKVRTKSGKSRLVPTEESRGMNDSRPVLRAFRLDRILPLPTRRRKSSKAMSRGEKGQPFVLVRHGKPAVFIRKNKRGIQKVRHLARGPAIIPPFRWHTDAIGKVWQQGNLDRVFRAMVREVMGV